MGNKAISTVMHETICELYKGGDSSTCLAERFQTSARTICSILESHGIPRTYQFRLKYELKNPRFFQTIDSEQKAYWLGFIAADGYINPKKNRFDIRLHIKDKAHLALLRDALGSGYPLVDRHVIDKTGRKIDSSGFSMRCADLARDLHSYPGMDNHKSFNLLWPDELLEGLVNHYIRGYMDGDGGFYVQTRRNRPSLRYTFEVTSTPRFLAGLQRKLVMHCNLRYTKLYPQRNPKTAKLIYGGRLQVERIYHYLYQNATIWLHRKRDKIEPFMPRRTYSQLCLLTL